MLMFYIKTKTNIGLGHGPGGKSCEAEISSVNTKWCQQRRKPSSPSSKLRGNEQRNALVDLSWAFFRRGYFYFTLFLSPGLTCVVVVSLDCGGRAPPVLVMRLHDAVITRALGARVLHNPDHVLNIILWNTLILNIARLNFVKLRDKNPQTEVWIWIDSEVFG